MALCFKSGLPPIAQGNTNMSDGQVEEILDEFQNYLFIRWKINSLHPKSREFFFRESKFTLVFEPTLCKSNLFVFLQAKSSSAQYHVKTYVGDVCDKEPFRRYYKGPLAQKQVIWSADRKKLMSDEWDLIDDETHTIVLCFKIATVYSDAIHGISNEDSQSLVHSYPYKCKIKNESSLENLSDDISQIFNSAEYSDVMIKSGERNISAHKNILSARSGVFAAMFRNEMLESKNGVVDITDVKPEVLNQFLRYFYSGKIELCMESARMVYEAADKYAVDDLKIHCGSYLFKNLEELNACEVMVLADTHGDHDLMESVKLFMVEKKDFLQSEQWEKFSEEYPDIAVKVYKMFIEQLSSKPSENKCF